MVLFSACSLHKVKGWLNLLFSTILIQFLFSNKLDPIESDDWIRLFFFSPGLTNKTRTWLVERERVIQVSIQCYARGGGPEAGMHGDFVSPCTPHLGSFSKLKTWTFVPESRPLVDIWMMLKRRKRPRFWMREAWIRVLKCFAILNDLECSQNFQKFEHAFCGFQLQ